MSTGSRQLPLDLPISPRYGAEDFLVSDCNETAYLYLERWPDWPARAAVLTGPPGSGKTHLAAIFAARAGGVCLAAVDVGVDRVPSLAERPAVVVEDVDRPGRNEAALFHLFNLAREGRTSVLFTGTGPLPGWGITTPDLLSRLRLAPALTIEPPDDALLGALLVKMFVDRQLVVDTHVLAYVLPRIERTFAAARAVVEALDREGLARGRRITRAVAAAALGSSALDDENG